MSNQFNSLVTYRTTATVDLIENQPTDDQLSSSDHSESSGGHNNIRTRRHFPETWLWHSLLVNGYLPPPFSVPDSQKNQSITRISLTMPCLLPPPPPPQTRKRKQKEFLGCSTFHETLSYHYFLWIVLLRF